MSGVIEHCEVRLRIYHINWRCCILDYNTVQSYAYW